MSFRSRGRPEPERRSGLAPNGLPFESVWDYPRPPALRPEPWTAVVRADGLTIATSQRAVRVCETAGGPVVYLPFADVEMVMLRQSGEARSWCEWKGVAEYFDVVTDKFTITRAAWTYPDPSPGYESLAGHLSFYPSLVDCTLDGEEVQPQPGGFYGGWMTSEITGPVKGEPGTGGW